MVKRFIALSCACLLILPGEGLAEETQRDVGYFQEQVSSEQEVSEAAEEARRHRVQVSRKISFQEILKNPDDIELNFEFAKQQIAEGDLLGASSTLERILLIDPSLHKIRLLFAVVLFRLDNLEESEQALVALEGEEMPNSLREEIKAYRKLIRQAKKQTQFSIRQTLGWGIDDNRNAAASSKRRLFAEVPLALVGTNRKRRDTNFLNVTTFGVTRDLGYQAGHEVFGSFTYYLQEQTQADDLDLQSFQYEFGGTYKSDLVNITPSISFNHIHLSRETFLRTQSGRIQLDRNFKGKWDVYTSALLERQDFTPITENGTNRERKGRLFTWDFGASYLITNSMRLSAGMGYTNKSAEEDFNAYEQWSINTSHSWLLGDGQFLINSINFEYDYYDEPDITIAGRYRRDRNFRYRVTYGAPLTSLYIGKLLPKSLGSITASISYEYFRSFSTITNFTYRNNKCQILLTKRWHF